MTQVIEPLSPFAETILRQKYLHDGETGWEDIANRVAREVVGPYFPGSVEKVAEAIRNREFLPGGRHLANAGFSDMNNNCYLFRVKDSKEEIADFFRKGAIVGMTGGGVGAVWSDLRPRGSVVKTNGGTSTGPTAFMQSFNEIGRGVVNGGGRRMAIWAGLHWWHPDVFEFMALKDWDEYVSAAKNADYSAYAPMDMTNISVILDDSFFRALEDPFYLYANTWHNHKGEQVASFEASHEHAMRVYKVAVEKMLKTGEPGFSVDIGANRHENLRNPCTEITSEDDNDICCLGSINLARIDTPERLAQVTALGTLFLLCSTLVSSLPIEETRVTREKNRRLGLGVMGLYEWLVARGYRYEPNNELAYWLGIWKDVSDAAAHEYASLIGVSAPIKVRAVAPTGTIGIIAETTTGIEPLFAAAYKRRYRKGDTWMAQYVVDATAKRIAEKYRVDPDSLETAYELANDPGRRLAMQAFVQRYTDHAISSTINLPKFEDQSFTPEEFAETLLRYLPALRGVTVYPDGARAGQPLNVVPYAEAIDWEGVEFEEAGSEMACVSGVCGI